jgi:MFS family permease
LTYQLTASLLQPMVGFYTDRHPKPYSLSIGMGCTLTGLMILAFAPSYEILFQLAVQSARIHLFVFLSAVAVGTILGGHIGDRIGRKRVIWVSILGVAPFTLILPYANLAWTGPLAFIIGLILASAFPAILVFAQELLPGKVGMVAGLFFGLAFGMGGIGAAVLGKSADVQGIEFVYRVCAFLPLFGLLAVFLPDLGRPSGGKGAPISLPSKPLEQTDP